MKWLYRLSPTQQADTFLTCQGNYSLLNKPEAAQIGKTLDLQARRILPDKDFRILPYLN